ncbi:MAG: hypothetical protein P4L79_17780 [Legionella sp.]|uniref:hypothetical protein n=1 Tax=Legionella sp. TaxID=459 RepID=UPI0028464F73|nr:hypothetical protein [Legionella sp.]
MAFIRICTGKLKNKKDQNEFDDLKRVLEISQGGLRGLLIKAIIPRLYRTDPQFALLNCMYEMTLANVEVIEQAALPMAIDLYEYTLRLFQSKKEHMKKQRRALDEGDSVDPFDDVFKKLERAKLVSLSLSEQDGAESIESSYKRFCSVDNDEIIELLRREHNILDQELLDGFIACRNKYGELLLLASEAEKNYHQLIEKTEPNEVKIFAKRWEQIHKLITVDMMEIYRQDVKNKERKTKKNALSLFSFFVMDSEVASLNQQLDQLFDYNFLRSQEMVIATSSSPDSPAEPEARPSNFRS